MKKFKYESGKNFIEGNGFSCAFRQWSATSHCNMVHGYNIEIFLNFGTNDLDTRNWCMDFGNFKSLKSILESKFDHKTAVAEDDPQLEWFKEAEKRNMLELTILPAVGCEKFAEYIYNLTVEWMKEGGYYPRCELLSVKVQEHGANYAVFNNPTL